MGTNGSIGHRRSPAGYAPWFLRFGRRGPQADQRVIGRLGPIPAFPDPPAGSVKPGKKPDNPADHDHHRGRGLHPCFHFHSEGDGNRTRNHRIDSTLANTGGLGKIRPEWAENGHRTQRPRSGSILQYGPLPPYFTRNTASRCGAPMYSWVGGRGGFRPENVAGRGLARPGAGRRRGASAASASRAGGRARRGPGDGDRRGAPACLNPVKRKQANGAESDQNFRNTLGPNRNTGGASKRRD